MTSILVFFTVIAIFVRSNKFENQNNPARLWVRFELFHYGITLAKSYVFDKEI